MHVIRFNVPYGDTGPDGRLRLDALANYLQWAAIEHAEAVQQGAAQLEKSNSMWILHRLSAVVRQRPRYGETIEIATWPTGLTSVRAMREYELRSEGAVWGRSGSTWAFFDSVKRTPKRLPPEVVASFPIEATRGGFNESNHDRPLETPPAAAETIDVTLRPSDFDTNGHLNNAAYLDLALTAWGRQSSAAAPVGFVIGFDREIAPGLPHVSVALASGPDGLARFAVSALNTVRARGILIV